jgi:hypothetical protein
MRFVVVTMCILAICQAAHARTDTLDATEQAFADCRASSKQIVHVERVRGGPLRYRAWIACSLDHPLPRVRDLMMGFERYPDIFKHVHRFERVREPSSIVQPLGTYFGEGRVAMVRVWGIGNIDSVQAPDSSGFRLYVSQNQDSTLNAKWREDKRGWFSVEVKNLRMVGCIWSTGPSACRAAVYAQGDPVVWIPPWVFGLAIRIGLPSVLDDAEKALVGPQ